MFIYMTCGLSVLGRVLWKHSNFRTGPEKIRLQPSQNREVLRRVSTICFSLLFHGILALAADLPVRYSSRCSQFAVLLFQDIGFTSYGFLMFPSLLVVSPESKGIVKRMLGGKFRALEPDDMGQLATPDGQEFMEEKFGTKMTETSTFQPVVRKYAGIAAQENSTATGPSAVGNFLRKTTNTDATVDLNDEDSNLQDSSVVEVTMSNLTSERKNSDENIARPLADIRASYAVPDRSIYSA